MSIPSVKRIKEWFGPYFKHEGIEPEAGARTIRNILDTAEFYHKPDMAMSDANVVLRGHGVEALSDRRAWTKYHGDAIAIYVNMGDPYVATILYDIRNEKYYLTTWGDWIEKYERTHGEVG